MNSKPLTDRELVDLAMRMKGRSGLSWDELSTKLQIPGLYSCLMHGPSCLSHESYFRLLRWAAPEAVAPPTVQVIKGGVIHRVRATR